LPFQNDSAKKVTCERYPGAFTPISFTASIQGVMRLILIIGVVLSMAGAARAADLAVTVRTPGGKPVPNAVVMVYPAGGVERTAAIRFDWPYRMAQQQMLFDPFVLVVPVGAEVSFPNLDVVRHHVYSFSPAKTFELKLYGKGEARAVRFDKVGAAAIGCNIHDRMVGFVKVVDTPYAAKTDAQGRAVVHGVRAGAAKVSVWHPYAKVRGGQIDQTVTVAAAGSQPLAIGLEVRAARVSHGAY